jgi:hypothetical protein
MATKGGQEPVTLAFGGGVANRMSETKVPEGFARAAKDVDISEDGVVSKRGGFTQFIALAGANSFWSDPQLDFALVAAANTLYHMDASGVLTALATNLTGADVHYCMTPIGVYWSDGQVCGCVDVLGAAHPWGVETPRFVTVSQGAGSLPAGEYAVTATFSSARGEGGAPASLFITLAAPGGISVTISSALDTSIDEARVYVTTPNGQELQYAASWAPGGTLVIGNTPRGRPLRTQYLMPLPPLRYPALSKGRLFGAVDRFLIWSEPLYYGLYNPTKNFTALRGQTITMVALADEAGFCAYIGTDRFTYKFAGDSIETATMTPVSHCGVMPGSMARVAPDAVKIEGTQTWVPAWVDSRGVPWAGANGNVVQLHDKFAYPQFDHVAAIFDQRDGNSRYILSGRGGTPSVLAFKDSFTAQVIDAGGGSA